MADPLIIDIHMHIYPTKEDGVQAVESYSGWEFGDPSAHLPYTHYQGDVEDALAAMDEAGVSRAVMVHFYRQLRLRHEKVDQLAPELSGVERARSIREIDAPIAEGLKQSNIWACNTAKEHPRLAPYICIDPWVLSAEEATAHLHDMTENHGAKGVKIHSVGQRYVMDDRRMWPIYQTCSDLGLGIVAHSGSAKGNKQYGSPKTFAAVYENFPDLALVMAHMGNGEWRDTLEIAQTHPNAVFDCCELMEWPGAPNAPTDHQLAQMIKDIGPERVMLGSDFPWWSPSHCIERVMGFPLLSNEQKEGILGQNAARILHI